MRIFYIYMAALKWTYPCFGTHGSALGLWKLDILYENPEILTDFYALIVGPFWPSKSSNLEMVISCIFVAHHVIFSAQFESTQSDNWVKSYGQNTDQCTGWNPNPNWALDNFGFFTFGQLLVDSEVLIWPNSRFIDFHQFINN